jgi:hypothetical protein
MRYSTGCNLETVDFKMEKVFANLSLGLPYYSMASSQLQSRDTAQKNQKEVKMKMT